MWRLLRRGAREPQNEWTPVLHYLGQHGIVVLCMQVYYVAHYFHSAGVVLSHSALLRVALHHFAWRVGISLCMVHCVFSRL